MNLKLILLYPFLEILAFILFGDLFGFFLVIVMIFLTGFFGLFLLKSSNTVGEIEKIAREPESWVYKKIAGILLIIPGFVSDILGLILLIRSFRNFVWNIVPDKLKSSVYKEKNKNKPSKEEIIEVDYRDLDEN